jgi:hypothetical protein
MSARLLPHGGIITPPFLWANTVRIAGDAEDVTILPGSQKTYRSKGALHAVLAARATSLSSLCLDGTEVEHAKGKKAGDHGRK